MNKIRTLLILTMLAVVVSADAKLVKGHVLINGKTATAEYTVLSDNTVGLGTGHNACTSQYLSGRLTVPWEACKAGTPQSGTHSTAKRFPDNRRAVVYI